MVKKSTPAGNPNLIEAARKALGKIKKSKLPELASSDYFHAYTYGIPIRNYLPLCRLFGTDVLPLSRAYTIVGPQESMKSSIGWFFMRLILEAGGIVCYIDTEKKQSGNFIMSIVDIPGVFGPNEETMRVLPFPCKTKEEVLGLLYAISENYHDFTMGRQIPMGIFLDSIKAAPSEGMIDAKSSGEASPGFSSMHDAKALQDTLMCALSGHITEKPILLMATNHQMQKKPDFPGQTILGTYEAGGLFKDFAWSGKLEMRQTKQEARATRNIPVLSLRMGKNSLHEKQTNAIPLRFLMEYDKRGKGHGRFDWDTAIAVLLSSPDIYAKKRSEDVLKIYGAGSKYTCVALNLREVDPGVIGRAIHESPEWRDKILREVFKIPPAGILHNETIYQPCDELEEIPDTERRIRGMDIVYDKGFKLEKAGAYPTATSNNNFPADIALESDTLSNHLVDTESSEEMYSDVEDDE